MTKIEYPNNNNLYIYNGELLTMVKTPEYKWTITLKSVGQLSTEDAPNWFHRMMQKAILGITWTRIKGK